MNALKRTVRNLPVISTLYPRLSKLKKETAMRIRFRTLRGDRVILPETGRALYVNPREPRGKAVFRCGGTGQGNMRLFWRRALETYQPAFVLDVGANYGECIFSGNYTQTQRMIAVEANQDLKPWLERSRAAHAEGDRIEMIYSLAAAESQKDRTLYVDKDWSGTSSALPNRKDHQLEEVSVDAVCLDDVFEASPLEGETLVFKLDVEGYEEQVMLGLRKTLERVGKAIGYVEFNNRFIEASGSNAGAFLDYLKNQFHIVVPHKNKLKPLKMDSLDIPALQAQFGDNFETDLLLFRDQASMEAFPFEA